MTDWGYARVSKEEQNLDLQLAALHEKGLDDSHILTDKISGTKWSRKGLSTLLKSLQLGDRVFVWKIDRLGRSAIEIILTIKNMLDMGVKFISITESIDTTGPMGEFMYKLLALFAELERNVISQRTKDGLKAARAHGRSGGRPRVTAKNEKVQLVYQLWCNKSNSIPFIQRMAGGISRATLFRYVDLARKSQQPVK